jgi:hypothetical protein
MAPLFEIMGNKNMERSPFNSVNPRLLRPHELRPEVFEHKANVMLIRIRVRSPRNNIPIEKQPTPKCIYQFSNKLDLTVMISKLRPNDPLESAFHVFVRW